MDGFYSIAEFLRIYAMGRTSLYRLVKAGQLRITKIGRASRIAKADAKAWADSLPTTGGGRYEYDGESIDRKGGSR